MKRVDKLMEIQNTKTKITKIHNSNDVEIAIFDAGLLTARKIVLQQSQYAKKLGFEDGARILNNMANTIYNEMIDNPD